MTFRIVVLLTVACFSFKAFGKDTRNTLYLAIYQYPDTYIGWLPANPESYKNNVTLIYNRHYESSIHYWTSVAADYHAGNVTFHDKENHWIYLSDDFETPGGGYANSIEGGTSGRVDAMTIDWLARNVYWVDEGYNWIKMTNYFGEGEALIVDLGLERPSGIACHPIEGYLFWTELGNTYPAKIERSSLSGANRVTIVTGVNEPTSIAVDTTTNRIYWTDHNATYSKIESSDLNGEDRRTEVSQPSSDGEFKSVSVDEDYIFASVFVGTEYSIRYYNKSTPSELVFRYNFDNAQLLNDLCVTGPNIQPKPATLPCDGHTCGHFCVSAAGGRHECICSEKYVLYPSGTCGIDMNFLYPPYYIIGRMNAVSYFDPTLLHYGLDDKQQYIPDFLGGFYGNVTAVAVDIHSNRLFYASDTLKKIYVIRLEDGQLPIVIRSNIGRVDGIAVDWISLNVYWVDYDLNRLMIASYDGTSLSVMFYGVINPRAIAVDPISRLIFWTEQTASAKIMSSDLDGTNRHDVTDISLQNPSGIALDHAQRRIYIVGEDKRFIYATNYDGTEQIKIIGESIYPASDITLFQDFIILAGSYGQQQGFIEAIHKSGEFEGSIHINTSVYAIDTFDESTQPIPALTTTTMTTTSRAQTTVTTTPTMTTTTPLSTSEHAQTTERMASVGKGEKQVTTTPTMTTERMASVGKGEKQVTTTPTMTTERMASVGKGEKQGIDSTLIIGGASGAVVLIIILLVIIIIVLVRRGNRRDQSGDTHVLTTNDNRYTTHLPQGVRGQDIHIYDVPKVKEDPPTYESSIGLYGGNQAIGGEPYIATKLDHQFSNPNTVALYSKSEPPLVLGNPYVGDLLPPQYIPEDPNGYLELDRAKNVNSQD